MPSVGHVRALKCERPMNRLLSPHRVTYSLVLFGIFGGPESLSTSRSGYDLGVQYNTAISTARALRLIESYIIYSLTVELLSVRW